ncbi:MAG: NADH-quinone oxidoreductase subunit NuoH [Saprospirales bacterium]|nr:NADH-quinone oxidoreductase subunit NuoH [Saprospirales bacterium]
MYDFTPMVESIRNFLNNSFGPGGGMFMGWALIILIFLAFYAVLGLVLVYVERRICAFFQLRLGPNRVGWQGSVQTVADAIKLLLKEPITILKADKLLFNLAPFIITLAAIMVLSVIPFAKGLHAFDINIGLFFIVAVSSIGVVGILLAGWASNNKYALIGAMRSGAQIVSYELSVGLSLITMVLLTGTLQLSGIIESQADGWWIFKGHIPAVIAFFLFLIASTAEINRGPFDLPEAESELTAGFHTEYSGLKFAFFFLAEFVNMFTVAAIASTVFLGGWMPFHIGGLDGFNAVMDYIPPILWFFVKVSTVIFLMMWFKWTFPRLRIDQLLRLEWKYLMPLNLINIVVMATLVYLGWHF